MVCRLRPARGSGGLAAGASAGSRQAPGGSIVSFVRDQSGRPLAGAIVSAVGRRIVTSVTDEQGRCVFSALPAGDYLVRVHRTGYVSTSSLLVLAGPGANTTWSFVLKTAVGARARPAPGPSGRRPISWPPVSSATPRSNLPTPSPAEDESSHDHSEVAWRLKHLKRSVLKEATDHAIFDEDGDPDEFDRAVADLFTRQTGPAQVAASLLSNFPFAGQVNLLTTGAFDSPQQLVSAGSLARGVAMVSLGASAGIARRLGRAGRDDAGRRRLVDGVRVVPDARARQARARRRHVVLAAALRRLEPVGAGGGVRRQPLRGHGLRDRLVVGERSDLAGLRGAVRQVRLHRQVAAQPARAPDGRARSTRVRVSVGASRRALAPGAEEFVPSMVAGTWLPPERTFAPIKGTTFVPERTRHLDVAVEHDLTDSTMVGVRAFTQRTKDQIVTLFGMGALERQTSDLGHYWVGTAGDVDARGYTVSIRQVIARRIRGSVDYTVATAEWHETADSDPLARRLPGLTRTGTERLHDVTTTIETELPITETRVFALYRINTGYAGDRITDLENAPDARFDVQVTQSLPFMNFSNAQWEMLLGVRNLFRDVVDEASMYDELLVVRPPKRIVGGLTLRF